MLAVSVKSAQILGSRGLVVGSSAVMLVHRAKACLRVQLVVEQFIPDLACRSSGILLVSILLSRPQSVLPCNFVIFFSFYFLFSVMFFLFSFMRCWRWIGGVHRYLSKVIWDIYPNSSYKHLSRGLLVSYLMFSSFCLCHYNNTCSFSFYFILHQGLAPVMGDPNVYHYHV